MNVSDAPLELLVKLTYVFRRNRLVIWLGYAIYLWLPGFYSAMLRTARLI